VSKETPAAQGNEAQKVEGPVSNAEMQPDIQAIQQEAEPESAEAAEANGSEVEEAEQEEQTEETPAEARKPRKPGLQKRIDELTAEKYSSKSEIERLNRELEQLRQSQQAPKPPVQQQEDREPTLEDFDFDSVAMARELARREARKIVEEERRALAEQQEKQKQEEIKRRFDKAQATFQQEHPDYVQTAYNPLASYYPPDMVEAIYESEVGPQLAYELGRNLESTEKLLSMSLAQRAREIGRIEARLQAKPTAQARTVTQAPAPVSTLSPSAPVNVSMDDMSMDEYAAKRKQQIAARR
jgi:chromosome segregation ATPase